MEKIKAYFTDMTKEKVYKLILIALAAIGILGAVIFFGVNCFDLTKTKKYNLYFAIILIFMIATTIYLLRILLLDKAWSYSRTFIVLALSWSVIAQLAMPPVSGADEVKHYYSAYHCSNLLMGMKDHELSTDTSNPSVFVEGQSYFYMRAEDYVKLPYVDVTFPYQFEILANNDWFSCSDEAKTNVAVYELPTKASRYIISAVGISIARILGWGFSGTIFLGRFMNTLFYVFMCWICIKLLPVGKLQMVSFSLMPTILELCNSYSYDNMSILFSMFLLSVCLYFAKSDAKLHAWHLIVIAASAAILLPNKTVYAIFAVWFFLIPLKKWWDQVIKSKKWYEYATLAVIVAGAAVVLRKLLVKYYYVILRNTVWRRGDTGFIEQDPSRPSYTVDYMKTHVGETLQFVFSGIKVDWWYNIKHVIGCELGHILLNMQVPLACTILLLVILIGGIVLGRGNRLKKWQLAVLIVGIMATLVAIFIGCLTRFTPLEGSERVQISYRYLIPLYMALCVGLGTDEKENKKALTLILAQNTVLIFAVCGVLYFLFHLRDGMEIPAILQQLYQ